MNLRQLEIFNAVMRASSMTEAARNLNISQPAVSTMLKHTEAQLGMKLFERAGGRLHPTPEAEILFADVEGIFARVETLRRAAQGLRDGRTGMLSVAASPTLANALLPTAIASFRRSRPQVRVEVQSLLTEQVVQRVARREVDVGLVYEPILDAATTVERVGTARVAGVMAPDHPLARMETVGAADLEGHSVITYGPNTPFGVLIAAAFRSAEVPLAVSIQVTYSLTACFLATQGAGVALVDPLLPMSGLLPGLAIRPFTPDISVNLELLFPRDRPRSRLAVQFAQEIHDAFAAMRRGGDGAAATAWTEATARAAGRRRSGPR